VTVYLSNKDVLIPITQKNNIKKTAKKNSAALMWKISSEVLKSKSIT